MPNYIRSESLNSDPHPICARTGSRTRTNERLRARTVRSDSVARLTWPNMCALRTLASGRTPVREVGTTQAGVQLLSKTSSLFAVIGEFDRILVARLTPVYESIHFF
jgi:hypothetical protein